MVLFVALQGGRRFRLSGHCRDAREGPCRDYLDSIGGSQARDFYEQAEALPEEWGDDCRGGCLQILQRYRCEPGTLLDGAGSPRVLVSHLLRAQEAVAPLLVDYRVAAQVARPGMESQTPAQEAAGQGRIETSPPVVNRARSRLTILSNLDNFAAVIGKCISGENITEKNKHKHTR